MKRMDLHGFKEKENMKANRFLPVIILFLLASLMFVAGCKYNVTTPLWDQPYTALVAPQITSVNPSSEAKPGVSTITISGHHFIVPASDPTVPDTTLVYFGSYIADVVSIDTTTIVVRRPNLVTDTCVIKVAPHNPIAEAIYGPYKLDAVIENYGGFLSNLQLGGIVVDNSEKIYVTETVSLVIHEASSATDNIKLSNGNGKTNGTPWGACWGPDGFLYIMAGSSRGIDKVNPTSGTVTQKWVQLPKSVKFGDFGPGGYLFTGGTKTDLYIVPSYLSGSLTSSQAKTSGSYAADTIFAVKVFNGYVYVASKSGTTREPTRIWRNKLLTDSTLGSREQVVDMNTTSFSSEPISGIAFSSAGTMYISTASTDPLLVVDPTSGKVDNFYKGIVPPYCAGLCWSKTSNYLYIISGNTAAAQPWTVMRIDMGVNGGANF